MSGEQARASDISGLHTDHPQSSDLVCSLLLSGLPSTDYVRTNLSKAFMKFAHVPLLRTDPEGESSALSAILDNAALTLQN